MARIAISGTHLTGKSTLIDALVDLLPGYVAVPEPYEILEEQGYEFAHPPTVEDYVVQLRQSLALHRRRSRNIIFDRCPLDFVAYILACPGADRFDIERWRAPIAAAIASLDLIVAIHIDPAHDPVGFIEDAAFRAAVDAELRDLLDDDSYDLCGDTEILVLAGPWDRRASTVLARLSEIRSQR
jgi:hypothetical protein